MADGKGFRETRLHLELAKAELIEALASARRGLDRGPGPSLRSLPAGVLAPIQGLLKDYENRVRKEVLERIRCTFAEERIRASTEDEAELTRAFDVVLDVIDRELGHSPDSADEGPLQEVPVR